MIQEEGWVLVKRRWGPARLMPGRTVPHANSADISGPRYFGDRGVVEPRLDSAPTVSTAMPSRPRRRVVAKPVKALRFAENAEVINIVGVDGIDDYTFDNVWADGTPKVRHRTLASHPHKKRMPVEAAEVCFHQRALDWANGIIPTTLPPARRLYFAGRINQFVPDANGDDVYEDQDVFSYPEARAH